MGFNRHLITCAIVSCLAASVHGASDSWGSFTFPPNSSVTNFSVTAPTVAKIGTEIHFNDDIVIEYTLPDNVKALWLSQQCYGAINDTNSTYGFGQPFQSAVYNESTGTLLWNLGNSTGEDLNYCLFVLYNWTIQSCSWGPFGLTGWEVSGASQGPLLVSELFKILPANTKGPSLIELAKTTTQSAAPVTATPGNVTCPPSGIPAAPISTAAAQMEMIPPLANGVTFPDWVYVNYNDED